MAINSKPDIHELVICANCFVRKDDKYLVLRRSLKKKYAPGVIHPIGGKVDLRENPYAAAVREVYEEAGIKISGLRLEAVFLEIEPHLGEPHNWMIFHFSADYVEGHIKTTEEGDLIWLTAEYIKKEKLFPSVELFINEILDDSIGTVFSTMEYDDSKQKIVRFTKNIAD